MLSYGKCKWTREAICSAMLTDPTPFTPLRLEERPPHMARSLALSESRGRLMSVPDSEWFFDDSMELRSSSFSSWDDSSDFYWKKKSAKETDTILKTTGYSDRPTTRRKPDYEPVGSTDEAQKKFGNVKAISSDMYFGRQDHADFETRARLERLSGSSSISSADLFDEQRKQAAGNYNLSSVLPTAPDMAQLKEGVRSVAGKLSVFANGVMTSIQVRGAARTGSEEEGGLVVVKMRQGPLFSRKQIRFYITDLDVCYV
ncbi:ADP-ribosylation factor GTPase-activating protein 3 [Myotis brandtii]|uniref:ADP-ribosylation factor GTPase-activating protein 3 n=1 Tax=Myotis brandtii TaxID=109478 RepID=S7MIK1_MYOBR|nr:ADP-ribosylation factor GTPase-activating protein 3 [Myotis brandtii]